MNTTFTGTGRLGRDPELRFTSGGKAICSLAVAFSNSKKKRGEDGYEYTPAMWVDVTLWEQMAQNAAEVLRKGDEVICSGSLELEEFERTRGERAGEKDSKLVLRNAEVAPSIRRGPVQTRERSDSRPPAQRTNGRPQPSAHPVDPSPALPDPWATR